MIPTEKYNFAIDALVRSGNIAENNDTPNIIDTPTPKHELSIKIIFNLLSNCFLFSITYPFSLIKDKFFINRINIICYIF